MFLSPFFHVASLRRATFFHVFHNDLQRDIECFICCYNGCDRDPLDPDIWTVWEGFD